jgi:hypothetical protein
MRLSLFAILLVCSLFGFSQQKDFGSWNVINTKLSLTSRWNLFNELQLRSQSFYANHFYYEIKGGISYALNKNFSFLIGTGKYITYTDGGSFKSPITANEFRLWEQVTMNQYLERIKFEHRYRIEQRWFKTGYRNRFRYRLNIAVPLNNKQMRPKTFYLSAFDELFLNNKAPHFERNRFFAGGGYQFNDHLSLQPGYVYQYDFRNNVGAGKHFLQLTLMIEIDAHKNPNEKIPGNVD